MSAVLTGFNRLCGTLIKVAGRGAGYALAGPVGAWAAGAVTDALVDAAEAEEATAALEDKVNRLIGLHYRAGKKWLMEAGAQPRPAVREKYIEQALSCFVNASQVELPMEAARAEAYVGTCHGLLARPDLHNFEQAFLGCERIEKALQKEANTVGNLTWVNCSPQIMLPRRALIMVVTSGLRANSFFVGSSVWSRFQELYPQMASLNSLLVARRSKTKLRDANSLTGDEVQVGDGIISWMEDVYCKRKVWTK